MPSHDRLSDAARVWNRACYREGNDLHEGDRALAAMLLVDGYIQNGGVANAFELSAAELAQGIAGYRFFGLQELAAIIKPHDGKYEAEFDRRYYQFTSEPNQIWEKFAEMFREHPERFAPLADNPRD